MTYKSNEIRNGYRNKKIILHPTLCTVCFKEERDCSGKTCKKCRAASKVSYIKNKLSYSNRQKEQRKESPKLNIARMVSSAKKRVGGNISAGEVYDLWLSQDKKCAISGIEMTWGGGALKPNTLSMDRIDQNKGYDSGNVRLVCHAINMFRGRMTDLEMLFFAESIVRKFGENKMREAA